jgi:hypothetical protein
MIDLPQLHITLLYSRRPTTLKERSDWPRRGWVVRVCPVDYASLLLKCLPESSSNFGRTEGRMPRSVNMVLYVGLAHFLKLRHDVDSHKNIKQLHSNCSCSVLWLMLLEREQLSRDIARLYLEVV